MFRHANTFANHPFHKTWSELHKTWSKLKESNATDYIIEIYNQIYNPLQRLSNFHTTLPKVFKRDISEMLKQYQDTIDESLSQINLPSVKKASNQMLSFKQRLFDGKDEWESENSKQ